MVGAYTVQNGTAAGFKVPQEKNYRPHVVSISAHCRPLIFLPLSTSSLKRISSAGRSPQASRNNKNDAAMGFVLL